MDTQTNGVPFQAARGRLIAAIAAAILAVVAPTCVSQAQPQAPDNVTYKARVLEVYADKAIIDIDGRRFLLEPIVPGQAFPGDIGTEIQVVGQQRGNILIPNRIILPSGAAVQAPSESGSPALTDRDRTLERQLAAHGIDLAGRPYRRRNHTVVAGRRDGGGNVIATFDHNLRLVEIEEAEHKHIHPSSPEALPEADVAKLLAKRGYSAIRLLDQSRFRFLYAVSGPQDERMELHVDRAGNILKRVWLR